MSRVRRRLSWLVRSWLLCQLCVMTAPSVALCAVATEVAESACTCAHGEGQECPMHYTTSKSKSCACRSAEDGPAIAMAMFIGETAILPSATGPAAFPIQTGVSQPMNSHPLDPSYIPDSPPPRA